MSTRRLTTPALTIAVTLPALLMTACADDSGTESICKYVYDPSECTETGGGTGGRSDTPPENYEESEGDLDEGDELYPCLLQADGIPRTVMQCNGSLRASIAFDTILGDCGKTLGDPGWCDEFHDFGVGFESYEMPAVMACCDPTTVSEDEVLRYCSVDMVEQVCRSIPKRLQMLIDEGMIKVGVGQARALRGWIDGHQQDCFEAFNAQGAAPGVIEPRSWLVNGGDNKHWPSLKNFTITIESAEVSSTTVPEDQSDWLACDDSDYNNTEVFEEVVPASPGITDVSALSEAALVSITGPLMFGNRVVGSASIVDRDRCAAPRCSELVITEDASAGIWVLEELSLFADGSAALTSGELRVEVEGAALRLFGVSEGRIRSGAGVEDSYVIQPGAAYFLVSGSSAYERDARWATNSSPIIGRRSAEGWVFDRFDVEHLDGSGRSWTLAIPSTNWD